MYTKWMRIVRVVVLLALICVEVGVLVKIERSLDVADEATRRADVAIQEISAH